MVPVAPAFRKSLRVKFVNSGLLAHRIRMDDFPSCCIRICAAESPTLSEV
jgi:hypothetical protein